MLLPWSHQGGKGMQSGYRGSEMVRCTTWHWCGLYSIHNGWAGGLKVRVSHLHGPSKQPLQGPLVHAVTGDHMPIMLRHPGGGCTTSIVP